MVAANVHEQICFYSFLRNVWAGPAGRGDPINPPVVMASGHVKWFDNKKGFGFISYETDNDVFVHYSAIQTGGFKTLKEGELVNFELVEGDKGLKAQNVQRAALEV